MFVFICVQVLFFAQVFGQLEGSSARCENEGEKVNIPILSESSCIACYCRNGEVSCEKDQCKETTGCHTIMFTRPKGACCDVCKGCWHNGTFHQSGSSWSDPSDPCQSYSCKAGVMTASQTQCYIPCSNPVQVPGQCCPTCSQCTMDGETYKNGQVFSPKLDTCVKCQCKGGSVQCSKPTCPVLNCPEKMIYQPQGECPMCRGSRTVFDIPRRCLFRQKVYKSQQGLTLDKCTQCMCNEGTMECKRETCPVLDCHVDDIIFDASACCAKCHEKSTRSCTADDQTYLHGEVWRQDACSNCTCDNGRYSCQSEVCGNSLECPPDHHLTTVPGECCPVCVEKNAVCTVFGDPHYKTFDGRIFEFQGTCKYILTQDCSGSSDFSIRVRNLARHRKPFAWTKSVIVLLKDYRITFLGSLHVKVHKKRVQLPYVELGEFSIVQAQNIISLRASNGLTVSWNGDSFLEVAIPSSYKNRVCGLCGNYNNFPADDFTGRDSKLHLDATSFGNSWRFGSKKACGDISAKPREISPCQLSFSKWRRAHKSCVAIKSLDFAECRKVVDVRPYYKSCLTDVCNCPKKYHCACDALTAYAHACEHAGVKVDWRRPAHCAVY